MAAAANWEHDALAVLAAVPYFADVEPSVIQAVAQAATRQTYDANQVVFLEGEATVAVYVVQSGWLKITKLSPDGREQVLQYIGPGETINAVGIFISTPNPASAITLEPSMVWVIRREELLRMLDTHPSLARGVIQNLAQRMQHLVTIIEDLSLRTIEARVARYLLEEAPDETLHRHRWATQAELANRLGTVPDVLNRALRNLVKENLIAVERQRIQILDRVGLERRAQVDK
ncbi:MAG: Crp/Fnr family transcriptional regulator [Anaerolineaceae bacterium]|nr:Crp/Fnr family transcriptional regulator [Anaerolineaceae bacterium]